LTKALEQLASERVGQVPVEQEREPELEPGLRLLHHLSLCSMKAMR
jgi:hypothetical protein